MIKLRSSFLYFLPLISLLLFFGGAKAASYQNIGELVPVPGNPDAPNFTLTDRDGKTHSLSEYRGKVVIVNFWATYCKPCRKEMPSMQDAWEQTRDQGVVLLAVNYGDSKDYVEQFFSNIHATFPVLLGGDQDMMQKWGVRGLPTTFVVDPEGRLAYKLVGEADWASVRILDKVLALKS